MNVTLVSQPSFLDWALGLVSLASVVVITWQAAMTSRSVRATQLSLALAEKEQDRNTALIADAQRSRVDAEMPRLTVSVTSQPGGAFDASQPRSTGYAQAYEMGHLFTMPRDKAVRIGSRAMVTIRNDGPRSVQLTTHQLRAADAEGGKISLNVDDHIIIPIDRIETLERWIEIYDVINRGAERFEDAYDARAFSVLYDFPGSVGAVEEHLVLAGGTVIEPVDGDAGAWFVPDLSQQNVAGHHMFSAQRFTRRYRLPSE